MKTVYLAAPLFSEAECDFNRKLKDELHTLGFKVFLPQEDSNNVHDKTNRQKIIFNKNLAGIENSDIIVAVIDGADVDSGTAWEIGYAFAKGKPVIGLRTDFRTLGIEGTVNLMIERSVILSVSLSELLNHLKSMADRDSNK
jgi:nucleoside 2-deoxyribosyltransferase